MAPDATRHWPLPADYDFFETTRMLRTGRRDPTTRREPDGLWRTTHNAYGPVTVRFTVAGSLRVEAWGPGAELAMAGVARWIGLKEAAWELPPHPVTDRLMEQHRGLRLTDTGNVFEALVNVTLQQKVPWVEAATIWRRLCERLGDPAPGPGDLRLPPMPQAIRAAGQDRLQAAGIGGQRARTLMEIARSAHALERAAELPTADAEHLLQRVRGVGPWTAAMVMGLRSGRPEPIPLGDYDLPDAVGWALAGERRTTEERMLELLEPFRGQAFRVVRLIMAAHLHPPRRGPRRAWRTTR